MRNVYLLTLRTVPAVWGTLQDSRELRALVVRNEVVVGVPEAGRFVPLAAEESRVRAGEVLGILLSDTGQTVLRAPRPGIVRFHWDGWEHYLDAHKLWQRTPAEWRTFTTTGGRTPGPETVERGTAVMRLVDSHAIRLYADMPPRVDLRPGQKVSMRIADATDETLRATVIELRPAQHSQTAAVLFEVDRYLPLLDAVRHIDVQIVLASFEGIIVPVDALVWGEQGVGVLVRRKAGVDFEPIELLAQVDKRAAVDGVTPGTRIVVNPWRVRAW